MKPFLSQVIRSSAEVPRLDADEASGGGRPQSLSVGTSHVVERPATEP